MKKLLPWQTDEDPAAWFLGKTDAELDVIEHGGRAFYSEVLRRKKPADGQAEVAKLRIRVPNTLDKAKARVAALLWASKIAREEGLKMSESPTIAEAEAVFGAPYFDELDTIAIIAQVAYEHDRPDEPFFRHPEMLAANYTTSSLMDLWTRIGFYQRHEDVRVGDLTRDKFIEIVVAIGEARNTTPLFALDGFLQDSFIVTMADQLASFLTPKSSLASTGT